jgi:DNA-binding XRE family transcriptional regulator
MGERQVLQPAWNKPVNWRKWRDSNPFCHIEIAKKRRIARGGRNVPPQEIHTLGDPIRARRLALNLTRTEAAELIGASLGTLEKWEANALPASQRFRLALAGFRGPDLDG